MRRAALLWAIGGALLIPGSAWLAGVRLNLTSSLPAGLYLVTRRAPTRGTIVLVCLPSEVATFARIQGYVPRGACPAWTAPVGKTVLAVPGDTVAVLPGGLQVDGAPVPTSLAQASDSHGRPLPSLSLGRYAVRGGELWLVGRHSLSFDSRYFGPVASSGVLAVIRPVWLFGGK
jgi:conjugative transfer signal peptidase TraF